MNEDRYLVGPSNSTPLEMLHQVFQIMSLQKNAVPAFAPELSGRCHLNRPLNRCHYPNPPPSRHHPHPRHLQLPHLYYWQRLVQTRWGENDLDTLKVEVGRELPAREAALAVRSIAG
jgi:hypothetical protein